MTILATGRLKKQDAFLQAMRREQFLQQLGGEIANVKRAEQKLHDAETALSREVERYRQVQAEHAGGTDCEADIRNIFSSIAKANQCVYQRRYEIQVARIELEHTLEQLGDYEARRGSSTNKNEGFL